MVKKWHNLAVKRLPVLLRGIASNPHANFYYLICLHSYRTKNELKKYYNVCENHDYSHVEMSNKDNKILKYNRGEKCIKAPFIIYLDLESFLEKMSTCHNNPEKSSK